MGKKIKVIIISIIISLFIFYAIIQIGIKLNPSKHKNNNSIRYTESIQHYDNYIKYSNINGKCPTKLYALNYGPYNDPLFPDTPQTDTNYYEEWYADYPKLPNSSYSPKVTIYDLIRDCENDKASSSVDGDKEFNCETLINDEIREYINTLMSVIRIGVPILLIGLVTYDLATAVLSGDEKAVNNARSKAMKRIIIAVIIFFVPTLLNVMFDLVNEIWETKFQICGLDK